MHGRILADYWIETAYPLVDAAEVMAGEQSSGTFVKLPGETPELRERSAARVEKLEELEVVAEPSLHGAGAPKGSARPEYRRAHITLSWPLSNMGPSLPNLMATVAGNLFELKQFSGLRLLDVRLPEPFRDRYQGPQFGVAGTRRLSGVQQRPLVGTIIKPSVGLSPAATAEIVQQLAEGGIDFIKDDELQADGPHCPFHARVEAVMRVINEHAERSGKKVMYAFNVTGEIDEMKRRHDLVADHGGTCIMVSLNSAGLPGLVEIRRHARLPIHAHRNGWGIYSRSRALGMSYVAYQKFWRLAGADHMHVNGLRNKFCEPDDSVIASARECLTPMFDGEGRGCEVMPVFSSGQWAGQAPDTYRALGSTDLIYTCGGGIMAHPAGIAAGVRSIRQAWEAALEGQSLDQAALDHSELPASHREVCAVTVHPLPGGLLLTYYGDDFSGSTDVAEVLTFNGLATVLFLQDPGREQMERFAGYRAVGIAGVSRSQSPQWMTQHLPPIFERLKALGAPLCHYKVCSTFDSSPKAGSIGKAIELGQQVFGSAYVPLVVGAPALKRYQLFGNLFATVDGETYRLDRHPTMKRHPVTPMDEADLRLHLARQTPKQVALVDILALRSSDCESHLNAALAKGSEVVLYDVIDEDSLRQVGKLIWTRRPSEHTFVAGSSGLEYALVAYWRSTGELPALASHAEPGEVDRIVVVSGSCSPATESQLRYAMEKGYAGLRLDARKLAGGDEAETRRAVEAALGRLAEGRSVVLYSALGPEDPGLVREEGDFQRRLGSRIGEILRDILQRSGLRRAVVAGGDTSGQAGRQLGIYALTVVKPMAPGSPLCRAWADGPFDGLEIVFKGGQVGNEKFFEKVRLGG